MSEYDLNLRVKARERVERLKNIVVDGLYESPTEDLNSIIGHMCFDMQAPITPGDVIEVKRIGPPDGSRRWPRPVRVIFKTEDTRMRVYENRNNLAETRLFSNIRINPDEPRDIRIKKAQLRQAAEIAVNLGKNVLTSARPGEIVIEGIRYNMQNTDEIPDEYRTKPAERKFHNNKPFSHTSTEGVGQKPAPNQMQNNDNRKPYRTAFRRLKDGNTRIDMVGPCLQKTKRGLAFLSGKCFLSNFYKCPVRYNGHEYKTSEHCWQAQKAIICKDPIALAEIKSVSEPLDAKRIGERIIENEHWRRIKIEKMADILQHKFRQNTDLYYKLINTRPFNLIEASLDGFWGAHCKLYSESLMSGSWTGQNILGKLLVDLRTDLIREVESKRLRTPPRAAQSSGHRSKQVSPKPYQNQTGSPMQVDKILNSSNSTRL